MAIATQSKKKIKGPIDMVRERERKRERKIFLLEDVTQYLFIWIFRWYGISKQVKRILKRERPKEEISIIFQRTEGNKHSRKTNL